MKNIFLVVVVCLVALGVMYEYRQRRGEQLLSSGDTVSPDGSAPSSSAPIAETSPGEQGQTVKRVILPGVVAPVNQPIAATEIAEVKPMKPLVDTFSPNPPNGTVFSGTGHFQVYRQGNLTWRLDTDNGGSCVLFATDAEWKKSRVYERGCAQR